MTAKPGIYRNFLFQMQALIAKRKKENFCAGSALGRNVWSENSSSKIFKDQGQWGDHEEQRAHFLAPQWQPTTVEEITVGPTSTVIFYKIIPLLTSHQCSIRTRIQHCRTHCFCTTQCTVAWSCWSIHFHQKESWQTKAYMNFSLLKRLLHDYYISKRKKKSECVRILSYFVSTHEIN